MFKRLKTLWKLSGIELDKKMPQTYINPPLTLDGVKERIGIKKMAKVIEDPLPDLFEENDTTS